MPKEPQGQKVKPLSNAQKRRLREGLNAVDTHLSAYHRIMAAQNNDPKYPATALSEQRKADNRAKRKHHLGAAAKAERNLAERRKRDA